MNQELLFEIIRKVEAEGFKIRGIVFDCGNQGIMSELGFYKGRYHFKNPADPARDICLSQVCEYFIITFLVKFMFY